MNLLCFSSSDWEGKWGSRQQVMLRFARRGYRVLFVERQAGLEHLLRYPTLLHHKLRRWREGLRQTRDNLWVASLPPLLPGRYYSATVNQINQRLTARWTQRYLHKLALKPAVLWLYRPELGSLIGQFGERLSVYHCIDEFTADTKGRKRRVIAAMEAELLSKADLVFANSLLTYKSKRQLNPKTYHVPSGADVEHFAQVLDAATTLHPMIAAIPRPIAGYVGNVNEKLDIPLLAATASSLTDWQFVFVGQLYPQKVDLRPLQAQPNIHLLGRFPFEEMPSLVKGMDVCLLPYADTEFARYRSPLKLYEYLAAGKPIVSTNHPEAREFSAHIGIASTPKAFASAIVQARQGDSPEKQRCRVELSQQHSWDHRVDEMARIMLTRLGEERVYE